MGKRRKVAHVWSVLLMAVVLAVGTAVPAAAAETADLDLAKSGSVSLTLADSDGNAVSGGEVTLYEVAELYLDDGDMAYKTTDDFSGCTAILDAENTGLAAELVSYVEGSGISGMTTAPISSDGKVSFDGLTLGIYLVVQTGESDDYEAINPFVVTVPVEEDGVWVYDVDASPKVGTVALTEPEEDNPPTAETEETPGTETTKTTETTDTAKLTSTLPQTGQLNWLVPVLAACGVSLVLIGWLLVRPDRDRNHAS